MQSTNGQAPPKFSRYRSVRQAAASQALPAPNVSNNPDQNAQSASIARSMSRYRRRHPTSNDPNALTSHPPVPPLPGRNMQSASQNAMDATSHPILPRDVGNHNVASEDRTLNGHSTQATPTFVRKMAQMALDDDHQVKHRQDAMDRLNSGLDNPPQSANPFQDKYAIKEKTPVDEPTRDKDRSNRSSSNSDTGRRSWVDKMKNTLSRDKHVAPGFDAPVSAVNSGERKVRVEYKTESIIVTVTPTTHADDILFAASEYWPDIDAHNFMLMESFTAGQISLERALRRYEYIREVMNSWAYDSENKLFILPPTSAEALERLQKETVSPNRPADITFHVYHSQKPKKWEKRHVTLRSDGQVTVSKKTPGKGETNICHISDFDIYNPNSQTVAIAKAPKRWCYAIKSQQKSSLFVSTEKFVHFFATDDRSVADGWLQAVQSWRSWYMVNMLGLGDPQVDIERRKEALGIKAYHSNRNSDKYSSDSDSYPHRLIDQATSSQELFARKMGMREHGPPPAAFPKKLTVDTGVDSLPGPLMAKDESPFSPTGLLGQTYTMRQRDMREREEREKQEIFSPQGLVHRQASSPPAPGQLNSRSNTMNSTQVPDRTGSAKASHSTRQPKPLVDLTPVFQEQPQHRNKGRGVTVTPGVPLVEAATGPDLAPGGIAIPPATTWRRPQHPEEGPATQARSRYRSNTARSAAQQNRMAPKNTYRTAPSSPTGEYPSLENPFAPDSLLSRAPNTAQSARPIGHGVATGDRNATRPMLDLSEDNPFAQGSLLRGL